MRLSILVIAVSLPMTLGIAHAGPQIGHWASPKDPAAKTIAALEDMWAHTACSSVPPALKAAFAEDFQGTAPNGLRYGRPQHWGGRGDNLECQLEKIRIRLFGDSVAVAYGNESSVSKQKDGRLLKHCLVWTDTWLMRKGKWQIVAAQDNRVTCQ